MLAADIVWLLPVTFGQVRFSSDVTVEKLCTGGKGASYHPCQQEALGIGAHSGGAQLPVQGQRQHWQQRCQQLH